MIGGVTRRQMLREVHLHAYENTSLDSDLRWLLGYVQEGTRFSKLVHQDFAALHAETGESAVVPFRAMQSKTTPLHSRFGTKGLFVGEATEIEVRRVLSEIAKTSPHAYVDALDLVPERFGMIGVSKLWKAAGLEGTAGSWWQGKTIACSQRQWSRPAPRDCIFMVCSTARVSTHSRVIGGRRPSP